MPNRDPAGRQTVPASPSEGAGADPREQGTIPSASSRLPLRPPSHTLPSLNSRSSAGGSGPGDRPHAGGSQARHVPAQSPGSADVAPASGLPESSRVQDGRVNKPSIGEGTRTSRASNYRCTAKDCNNAYSRYRDLRRHVAGFHNEEKPYKCGECGMKFARKDSLLRHSSRRHKSTLEANKESEKNLNNKDREKNLDKGREKGPNRPHRPDSSSRRNLPIEFDHAEVATGNSQPGAEPSSHTGPTQQDRPPRTVEAPSSIQRPEDPQANSDPPATDYNKRKTRRRPGAGSSGSDPARRGLPYQPVKASSSRKGSRGPPADPHPPPQGPDRPPALLAAMKQVDKNSNTGAGTDPQTNAISRAQGHGGFRALLEAIEQRGRVPQTGAGTHPQTNAIPRAQGHGGFRALLEAIEQRERVPQTGAGTDPQTNADPGAR